jgi:glycosyltransferase involved in cell wall biosynthesis
MSVKGKHLLHYVPHGIDSDIFKSIDKSDKNYKKVKKIYFGDKDYDFVIGFNSRNAHRKHPSNLIVAFKNFCDHLPKEESSKCALVMHTDLVHDAGTDLIKVAKTICPNYTVSISNLQFTPDEMCGFYNICDIIANVSSNEGFGLSIAESLMCEKPIISTVTGGLQDQLGFTDDDGNEIELDVDFSTNSVGKYLKHGKWAKPIFPDIQTLQGSPETPYIFDDLVDYKNIGDAIMYWYLAGKEKRLECGKEGRRWALNEGGINSKNMCDQFIKAMDYTIDNFIPQSKFDVYVPTDEYNLDILPQNEMGIQLKNIDIDTIKTELKSL